MAVDHKMLAALISIQIEVTALGKAVELNDYDEIHKVAADLQYYVSNIHQLAERKIEGIE